MEEQQDNGEKVLLTGCMVVLAFWGVLTAVLLMGLLFSSCRTTKVGKSEVRVEQLHSEISQSSETISQEEVFRKWMISQWRDIDLRILIYDRPDSTNHQPLIADITMSGHEQSVASVEDSTTTAATTTVQSAESIDDTKIEDKEEEKKTETKICSLWQFFALMLTASVAIGIFAWGQGWIKL